MNLETNVNKFFDAIMSKKVLRFVITVNNEDYLVEPDYCYIPGEPNRNMSGAWGDAIQGCGPDVDVYSLKDAHTCKDLSDLLDVETVHSEVVEEIIKFERN